MLSKFVYNHKLVSKKYYQEMLDILGENVNHSKLPSDLDSDVTVYNKTGEFNQYGVQNDAAIFEKDGKAFVIVVMSQDGDESDQKDAMGRLGSDLADLVFD